MTIQGRFYGQRDRKVYREVEEWRAGLFGWRHFPTYRGLSQKILKDEML